MRKNDKDIIKNDEDIKRQVPGILNDHFHIQKSDWLRDQELFYRATDYRGS